MCFLEEIKMKQNLMRLLARNRGRGQFEIKAAADGKEATVYLYDAIVATEEEAEWYGGVSAQSFVKQLAGLEADTIHLRINSPGGSVFAGRAMETALRQHSAKVIVYVDGLAAYHERANRLYRLQPPRRQPGRRGRRSEAVSKQRQLNRIRRGNPPLLALFWR